MSQTDDLKNPIKRGTPRGRRDASNAETKT